MKSSSGACSTRSFLTRSPGRALPEAPASNSHVSLLRKRSATMFRTVSSFGAIARRSSMDRGAGAAIFTLASTSADDVFARLLCISIIAPEL